MSLLLGIDIGSVSIKCALIGTEQTDKDILDAAADQSKGRYVLPERRLSRNDNSLLLLNTIEHIKGDPATSARKLIDELFSLLPGDSIKHAGFTGSVGRTLADQYETSFFNDFLALAEAVNALEPQVRTVFEMGGEKSKYIRLSPDPDTGKLRLIDYEMSGECAAGTGSFIDQQAGRLQYRVDQIGALVTATRRCPTIAGRCSVFAKSDMIHAQQKGYKPPEILKGLCEAVSRNFKSAICKGKEITPPVAFVGGVAGNEGIVEALRRLFELEESELFVPDYFAWMSAIGAALLAGENESPAITSAALAERKKQTRTDRKFPSSDHLDMNRVVLLRDRVEPYVFPEGVDKIDAFLGVDIGSISTNLVVIDSEGNIIYDIYTRTRSRPIEVVSEGLLEIEREIGDRINIRAAGTTGSGRELIGELIGADAVNDEITAHQTGANFIARKMLNTRVDTIFEIGGQDSKFISLQDGIVVDFAMNDACAAGTGSFLEERADELGISIKDQFAELALKSTSPVKLGERCTVFIESDVKHYLSKGAPLKDVVAGLAYSVAYNYINRVVRGRDIRGTIFFQGGTAYNDAVAAAFSKVLDMEIIVPPHNGVVGAFGTALLARDKIQALKWKTTFRGFHMENLEFSSKEFTCKACSNFCDIIRFEIEGEVSYWGDRCSDRYRKKAKVEKKPVIKDLFEIRESLLLKDYDPEVAGGPTIGIPRAMYFFDRFPFWNALFRNLGARVVLSEPTSSKTIAAGEEATIAEPCFPIKVAHGHIAELIDKNVDYILLPNNINAELREGDTANSFYCPWNTTLPFVARSAKSFSNFRDRILAPTMKYKLGRENVLAELHRTLKPFGYSKRHIASALTEAYSANAAFKEALLQRGTEAMEILEEKDETGIILVGRPYNIYDFGSNISIPDKLRKYYGVNLIPLDFMPLEDIDISEVNENMYWGYGRKIIAAARYAFRKDNLHLIYITNFKCGPDSYIKHFVVEASGKPYLTLQFDGHANDAGIMTRCEAYLESKGMLRWWDEE